MPTVKLDIIGTSQTNSSLAVINNRYDRAIRRAIVTDLTVADGAGNPILLHQRLNEAIDAAAQAAGVIHPQNPTLPLQRVRGTLFGHKKALVTLFYRREPTVIDIIDPIQTAEFRTAYEPVAVYREPTSFDGIGQNNSGLPAGAMSNMSDELLADPERRPEHWIWQRPVIRIWARVILLTNPIVEVADVTGTTNSKAIEFSNKLFPENSIRFDGVDVEVSSPGGQGGNQSFDCWYKFTALSGGHQWLCETPEYTGIAGGGGSWDTMIAPCYRIVWTLADFLGL